MAKKNSIQNFAKNILSKKETNALKGGRNYEPNLTGSFGWVNWGDVDVRAPNFTSPSQGTAIFNLQKRV